jgi:hypothetical protein
MNRTENFTMMDEAKQILIVLLAEARVAFTTDSWFLICHGAQYELQAERVALSPDLPQHDFGEGPDRLALGDENELALTSPFVHGRACHARGGRPDLSNRRHKTGVSCQPERSGAHT